MTGPGGVSMQVPESKRLGDPPLLRLERESSHAYLSMLLHARSHQAELRAEARVEDRLMQLCTQNLERFQVCFLTQPALMAVILHFPPPICSAQEAGKQDCSAVNLGRCSIQWAMQAQRAGLDSRPQGLHTPLFTAKSPRDMSQLCRLLDSISI